MKPASLTAEHATILRAQAKRFGVDTIARLCNVSPWTLRRAMLEESVSHLTITVITRYLEESNGTP